MKLKDLRGLSEEELSDRLNELNKQFMELQFKKKSGVEKPHRFKQIKKDIARIFTILHESEEVKSGQK